MDPVQTSNRIKHGRRQFLYLAAGTIAATRVDMRTPAWAQAASMRSRSLPVEGEIPPLTGATAWINTTPLTPENLRGKVVLVEFWTYTCINWRRSHAYIRAWAQRYNQHGLVVLGVHTPEFPFERDIGNVRRAVQDMKISYPIAVDSDYAIWNGFANSYWPAFYFVDAQGRIRHHQFGERSYEQSEMVIQRLLTEAGSAGVGHRLTLVDSQGFEAAADWADLQSPENYLGYERTNDFSSVGGAVLGESHRYTAPMQLALNQWALSGNWMMKRGFSTPNAAGGRMTTRFHARDLHLVMGSSDPSRPIRFRIAIDDAVPETDHGLDIDTEGWGTVQEPRLYQLVRQKRTITDRTFGIEFSEAGSKAYAFTFG
jgi:thiol-disulfide isomerase/thioredoxin